MTKLYRNTALCALSAAAMAFAAPTFASVETGTMAPNFQAVDSNGVTHSLSDFKGKNVVLEWTNHECPYVVRHYNTDNMQNLQKGLTAENTVWLSVVSSAPGNQGYVSGDEANMQTQKRAAAPTAVLLDPKGDLGRMFDAKTTPHMYIIDKQGTLTYQGAIDDAPRGDAATANNYVTAAMSEMKMGMNVSKPQTTPYGCSVKY